MRRAALPALAVLAGTLALPATAAAVGARHAAPGGTGDCTELSPCSLETALAGVTGQNQHVRLRGGEYAVTATITAPRRITLGDYDGGRPVLRGAAGLTGPVVGPPDGSDVTDVDVIAAGTGPALRLTDGDARGLVLRSATGAAAVLRALADDANLADSVVDGPEGVHAGDGSGTPWTVALENVTARGSAGPAFVTAAGPVRVRNSVLVGALSSLDPLRPSIGHTNLRAGVADFADAGGNDLVADPLLDAGLRPLPGSPLIDRALAPDVVLGATDAAGAARVQGAAADLGGYETTPPPPPPVAETPLAPSPAPVLPVADLPPAAPPVLGRTVTVAPRGAVTIRLPGAARAVGLTGATSVPTGSVIDATRGSIALTTVRGAGGGTQTGTFSGGAFRVTQPRAGGYVTELALTGGTPCGRRGGAGARARTAAVGRRGARRVVRRLWGSDDRGRFRTRGRYASATVRGTRWLTEDRCDGTLVRVVRGAVEVRGHTRGARPVLVRAGRSRLVRG